MPGAARHHAVKHTLLPRMQPRKRRPHLPQILLVVRMGILREICFQPVVPLFRQKNIRRVKQGQQLRARQNALLRTACPAEGEVPPIMAQAVPVRIHIVRHPVQHRQFAVAAVLRADIFARVVAHQPQRRMNRRPRLNRRIQRICRQRVLFVQRHGKKDARLFHASPPSLTLHCTMLPAFRQQRMRTEVVNFPFFRRFPLTIAFILCYSSSWSIIERKWH